MKNKTLFKHAFLSYIKIENAFDIINSARESSTYTICAHIRPSYFKISIWKKGINLDLKNPIDFDFKDFENLTLIDIGSYTEDEAIKAKEFLIKFLNTNVKEK